MNGNLLKSYNGRKVKGVMTMDRIRSDDKRERLRKEDVLQTVLRKRKKWLRKCLGSYSKDSVFGNVRKRPRWADNLI